MNLEIPSKYKGTLKAAYGAAEKILRPISRKYDLAEHTYPKELDMLAAALEAMNTPAAATEQVSSSNESNTKNGNNMQSVLYIQALNYGDVGMSLTIPGRGLGNAAISAVANPEQLAKFGKTWAAMAITEPGAGSDSAAITTTATKDGDFYILNGEKIYITAGERAGAIVVWATLDKG